MKYEFLLILALMFLILSIFSLILYFSLYYKDLHHVHEDKQNIKVERETKTEVAVVGIFGFIPFAFGTSKRAILFASLLAVAVILLFFLLIILRQFQFI